MTHTLSHSCRQVKSRNVKGADQGKTSAPCLVLSSFLLAPSPSPVTELKRDVLEGSDSSRCLYPVHVHSPKTSLQSQPHKACFLRNVQMRPLLQFTFLSYYYYY